MYKKVYIEITNNCNLSCSFCTLNKRKTKYLTEDEFKIILSKLKGYTEYLYFHVLGEPLMHPKINEFINLASKNFNVNITTNGYLLDRIKNNKNIRQINISLHSYHEKYNISIDDYLNNIFSIVDKLSKYTYISYRLWVKGNYTDYIINRLNEHYNVFIDRNKNNIKISNNIFYSIQDEFKWPNFKNNKLYENGTCYALKDQLGILVDGTVVPCCLDADGIINLGNIFKDDINTIQSSTRYKNMLNGFKNNKRQEELCKRCNFINKKN